jgi:hypothetical protein
MHENNNLLFHTMWYLYCSLAGKCCYKIAKNMFRKYMYSTGVYLSPFFHICRIFLYHLTLQNLYNFLITERNYIKLSQMVLHNWEICLLPLATLNWVTWWRRVRRITKGLLSNLLFFWWFFPCCGETSSRVLKKQELCVINVRRDVNLAHLFVQKMVVQHWRQ